MSDPDSGLLINKDVLTPIVKKATDSNTIMVTNWTSETLSGGGGKLHKASTVFPEQAGRIVRQLPGRLSSRSWRRGAGTSNNPPIPPPVGTTGSAKWKSISQIFAACCRAAYACRTVMRRRINRMEPAGCGWKIFILWIMQAPWSTALK